MKLKNKFPILFLLGISILAGYIAFQLLFPKARNIIQEKPEYKITATALQKDMSQPSLASNYIDRVLELKGLVSEVAPNHIMLDNKIQIHLLNPEEQSINLGEIITIKGRCVGFDDLLEEVKIDQATIIDVE